MRTAAGRAAHFGADAETAFFFHFAYRVTVPPEAVRFFTSAAFL